MRKRFPAQLKAKVVLEALAGEKTLQAIASEHGVHPNMVHKWRVEAVKQMPTLFEDNTRQAEQERKAREAEKEALYAQIGELHAQLAWLKKKSGIQ